MRCCLHSQQAAGKRLFALHTSNHSVCCCRHEERVTQYRHRQQLWCSADVVAPLDNTIVITADHAAVHSARDRAPRQHPGTTRAMHAVPQQPPVLVGPPDAALADQLSQAPQVQAPGFQQQPQAQQQQPLQHIEDEYTNLEFNQIEQHKTGSQHHLLHHNATTSRRPDKSTPVLPTVSEAIQEQQQQQKQQKAAKPARLRRRTYPRPLLQYKPCDKGGVLTHAVAISKHLQKGRQLLVPAGNGMQLARGVAALASARTLMLGHSSATGLVFQPNLPAAAAGRQNSSEADHQEEQHYPQQQQQQQQYQQQQLQGRIEHSSSNSSSSGSATGSSIMMFVSSLQEGQLRRFEQQPLIAAQYGSVPKLACAAFARVCQVGYTAVRAAGPNALAVALHAVAHARRKLLGCGLDLAVVPMTEFVDVDSLADADGQSQQFTDSDGYQHMGSWANDDQARQYVRITVLHIMRCEPQQPWKLLPWRPEPEQLPAVRWQQLKLEQQQQQQHSSWQQQRQQHQVLQLEEQQMQHQDVQQTMALSGSAAASLHVPLDQAQVPLISSSSFNSHVSDRDGSSLWGNREATQGHPCDLIEYEGEEVEGTKHSHAAGVVPRQPAVLLLQKQRTARRQLVAAAQSTGHVNRGRCSNNGTNSSSSSR